MKNMTEREIGIHCLELKHSLEMGMKEGEFGSQLLVDMLGAATFEGMVVSYTDSVSSKDIRGDVIGSCAGNFDLDTETLSAVNHVLDVLLRDSGDAERKSLLILAKSAMRITASRIFNAVADVGDAYEREELEKRHGKNI